MLIIEVSLSMNNIFTITEGQSSRDKKYDLIGSQFFKIFSMAGKRVSHLVTICYFISDHLQFRKEKKSFKFSRRTDD